MCVSLRLIIIAWELGAGGWELHISYVTATAVVVVAFGD